MTRTTRTRRAAALVATAGVAGLALAACSSGTPSGGDSPSDDGSSAAPQTIRIGVHSGWDEGIAVSELFGVVLQDEGYDVDLETADAGIVFTSLAGGDFDVNFDTWLPITHADYWDQYGDDLEDLGVWYDQAKLTIAVNEDAPIDSLDELAANADQFDNRLVGIEAGAGETKIVQDDLIPGYGLEGMDFSISSTPAMLAELKSATDAGRNVAVTLWRPHWAYDEFPIRDLADPQGLMGETEEIHTVTRTGFADDFPDVAALFSAFTLTDDQLFSLENIMFNENEGEKNEESVRQWLDDNPDFVDDLKAAAQA